MAVGQFIVRGSVRSRPRVPGNRQCHLCSRRSGDRRRNLSSVQQTQGNGICRDRGEFYRMGLEPRDVIAQLAYKEFYDCREFLIKSGGRSTNHSDPQIRRVITSQEMEDWKPFVNGG